MAVLTQEESIVVSRVLHAGYIFSAGATQIIFDPIFENPFSQNCYAFPAVNFDTIALSQIKYSAIFISHYHDDHCSFESLNLLDRAIPIFIYCIHDELVELIKSLGFKTVLQVTINQPVNIGPFTITARKALDADVDSIFQIGAFGLNILNVVDSWIDPDTMQQLSEVGLWDLILWPFQTMRELEVLTPSRESLAPEIPQEWIAQLTDLQPRYLIPSSCQFIHESWSWYNQKFFPISYQNFMDTVGKSLPQTQIFKLNPGESFSLGPFQIEKLESLPWIWPVGPQEVDYKYDPQQSVPTTSEIAKLLPEITAKEMQFVINFCKHETLIKFRTLEWPESKYFLKKLIWKLVIYDHLGEAYSFCYQINKDQIVLLNDNTDLISWLTEVPAIKVYSVLKNGESLSSMYLRINDCSFTEEQKMEMDEADILEDPLIRILFTGHFASYQKAQLQKINDKKRP